MNIGLCENYLNGSFCIWIFQFISSMTLFVVVSIAAAVYNELDAPKLSSVETQAAQESFQIEMLPAEFKDESSPSAPERQL